MIKIICMFSRLLLFVILLVSLSVPVKTQADDLNIIGKDADVFRKAVAYEDEGKIADAVAVYRLYIKKNRDIAPAYFYLGNLYWESGRKENALETYKQAEAACPG